jgi:hypothetical protein
MVNRFKGCKDPSLTRFVVVFLGLARYQWYKNDPKAFDKAVESPGAGARLTEYRDGLAVRFDTKDADFLSRYSRYFPAAGAKR